MITVRRVRSPDAKNLFALFVFERREHLFAFSSSTEVKDLIENYFRRPRGSLSIPNVLRRQINTYFDYRC